MGILVKNGEIVTASERFVGDVYCANGKILEVGTNIEKRGAGDQVIDASGQFVFPGGVDPHVHMELPFMGTQSADDFETGTAAGIAGGTTTIIDFIMPARGQSLLEALALWNEKAKKAVADYGLHMSVTWFGDKTPAEMRTLVTDKGIPSFKAFMAYRGTIGVDDAELVSIMQCAKEIGALIAVHAEHGDVVAALQKKLLKEGKTEPRWHAVSRPPLAEGEATNRATVLARLIGSPLYIVHMTSKESVEALTQARARGQLVFGETCPQYLLLDDSVYDKPNFEGAAYVMSPPIRPKGHQDALWAAVANGTIQIVATDHCPFMQVGQKDMGKGDFTKIPNGAAGIENRLALLYTYGVTKGRIELCRMVDLFATQPAKIFGLYPRKGTIVPGADADLVLYDPSSESKISAKTHHHRCDRNIFEGFEVKGRATHVIANGRVQWKDGKLDVERGAGRFLPRKLPPFAEAVKA